jgi:1-acyl-sn-glycerol-3-phosphate acyltransferase
MKRGNIHRSRFNLTRMFSRLILHLMGWKMESINIDFPKYILIGVPHTSNWDFIIGYMVMAAIGLKLCWVGKHTLFRWPIGWLLRRMGGIPVNRTLSTNFVDQVVSSFNDYRNRIVAIAPEGTRKRTDSWKSGFYYIAFKANIPIVFGFLDYQRRTGGTGGYFIPSGKLENDSQEIREFYENISPKFPENFGKIDLPPKKY